ncbi:fimbria/pilus outer membrane usher protein [Serratia marcescens]
MNANIERNWLARGVKKNRLVLNINQPIRDFGSLYINGYQQNYWHSDAVERNFLMGFSYLFTRTGLTASVLPGWDNLSSRCTP